MIPAGCVEACPGCRYRGLEEAESSAKKQAWVESQVGALAQQIPPLRAPTLRWGYRRKALLHARWRGSSWAFGMVRRTRQEEEFIAIPDCPLHAPEVNRALACVATRVPGEIPLVFVMVSGAFLTLVVKAKRCAEWLELFATLESSLRETGIEALQVNWNPAAGRRVLASRHQERVFGASALHDGAFFYGALSFRQQIGHIEDEAHALARSFLQEEGARKIVDLYCGGGTTLTYWQALGWTALGVELVGEACEMAARNAPQATVLKGRVEDRLPQLREFTAGVEFFVYTNPPRGGHEPAVLDWLVEQPCERMAYLSCNMKSLARDLARLTPTYAVETLQAFDFFPQTDHVEALALVRRV